MSKIGNNIRKIRNVKNLSQSDFADLFSLKRGSIGAYEEGRAEPKIATVIEIANHFGISMDDLLRKDLSINDLYRFDIFREELLKESKHNLKPSIIPVEVIAVPFVSELNREAYLNNRKEVSKLESINIPLAKGGNYRAFEISDDAMCFFGSGVSKGDVVIGLRPQKFDRDHLEEGKLYIFETKGDVLYRKLGSKNLGSYILEPLNPERYSETLNAQSVVCIWQVHRVITKNIGNSGEVLSRLGKLEQKFNNTTT